MYFYNNHRPQRKLNKLSPVQYRKQLIGLVFSKCPLAV
ncbi:hypothetical protein D3P09_17035 [Paenibacillus pinisoli]|uniref:Integrase catalytic domain-containing protein n=1 Tax=Paenibacillus pinisoli TaxID=1276110 RepID=A0A3A6PCW1_9BACL|nr:hypothetical protein D3P09_17035 [Paenibacillus pinisoli]